jgi:hypothetical protein
MAKIEVQCDNCGKLISKYNSKPQKRYFCCLECKNSFMKGKSLSELHGNELANKIIEKLKSQTGENNPNFGVKWSDEQKENQSILITQKMEEMGEELRKATCGKSNRGLKRSKEFIDNWNSTQNSPDYIRPKKTEETLKKIAEASSKKFDNPEYVKRQRFVMEERGHWIPLEEKTDWELYTKEANWIKGMWNLIEDSRGLLSELGVFHSTNNSKGVVRDHNYSRKSGFLNGVFPEILRHPMNCQILTHSENIKKKKAKHIDDDHQSLTELFYKIEQYFGNWEEHDLCLLLIKEYKDGRRYERRLSDETC